MGTTSNSILTRNSPILLPDLGVGQIAFVEDGNCLYVGTYNGNAKILGESPDSSPINAHEAHYDHALIHAPGSDNQDLSGLVVKVTGYSLVADSEIEKIHSAGSDNQDLSGYTLNNDARLSDARTPLTHTHSYEPANANIQTHVGSAHAPSNAQKNSDITKSEIEAVLTGELSSHTHAGGGGLSQAQVLARGLGA